MEKSCNQAQQHYEEENNKDDKPISRDPFFVSERPESLDTPRRQVTDQLRVTRRWTAEVIADAAEQSGKIILADAKLIKMSCVLGRIRVRSQSINIDLFEDRFTRGPLGCLTLCIQARWRTA